MSKFTRKTIALIKAEVTPGTDIVPAAANAVMIRNPNLTPLDVTYEERNIVRGFFGNFDALPTIKKVKFTFETEFSGSGTIATAPGWDDIMQACGHASIAPVATPVNSAFSTSTTGGTLAAGTYFYRVSALYAGGESLASAETSQITTGATSTVTVNWGAVANATGYRIYGRATGAEQLIGTVGAGVTTFLDTGSASPSGALPTANSGGIGYVPLSGTGKTVSIYVQIDGLQHKIVYARGTGTIKLKANGIPYIAWEFIGLDTGATDVANVTPAFAATYLKPQPVNKQNTTTATLGGVAIALESLDFNFGNSNAQVTRPNSEQVLHTDRKTVGSIMFEMTSVATKDWLGIVKSGALQALSIVHGVGAGQIMTLSAANVQLQSPQFSDIQGIQMIQMQIRALPTNAGNDEYSLANT